MTVSPRKKIKVTMNSILLAKIPNTSKKVGDILNPSKIYIFKKLWSWTLPH